MALNARLDELSCASTDYFDLGVREREILEILYLRGETTAREVQMSLPDAPGYSAVRAALRTLELKGVVKHRESGGRYMFLPAIEREEAKRPALRRIAHVFFEDSIEDIVRTLLNIFPERDGPGEVVRLAAKLRRQSKTKPKVRPTV